MSVQKEDITRLHLLPSNTIDSSNSKMTQSTTPHSWSSDWDREAKQPGLEVKHTWMDAKHSGRDVKQANIEAYSMPDEDHHHHRRLCGLKPATFCLVLLVIIVVVGGAIGGGIGGWIATHPPNGVKNTDGHNKVDPASGSSNYKGQFNLRMINATTAITRDEGPVYCDTDAKYPCVETLTSGTLVDRGGTINFINCNDQLQASDNPSHYCTRSMEFSVYSNGSLAVGGSALWYQCYTESWDSKGFFTRPKSSRCYPLYLTVADV